MKPNDVEFVRACYQDLQRPLKPWRIRRILNLLIESEAMREKAEYRLEQIAHSSAYNKSQRDWTDLDWIAAVRKEIEGE